MLNTKNKKSDWKIPSLVTTRVHGIEGGGGSVQRVCVVEGAVNVKSRRHLNTGVALRYILIL